MRSETVTAILDAPLRKVFEYIAEIEHLPEWATEFAGELRRDGEDYEVVNGMGEFYFTLRSDPVSGVIDMFAGPSKDAMAVFPTRAPALIHLLGARSRGLKPSWDVSPSSVWPERDNLSRVTIRDGCPRSRDAAIRKR